MAIDDGWYIITNRKFDISLTCRVVRTSNRSGDALKYSNQDSRVLIYQVAAKEASTTVVSWNVVTSSDDSGDTKIISINYEESSSSSNDSPNKHFATTYRAAMAAEDSSRTTYTTYKCPVSNTARAKTDQCTNWTISPVSVKTTSKVSKEVVEMSGTIVKTSTSETRETKEETFYTISHDQKLWKLTGGNAGDVVSIEERPTDPDADMSAFHFTFTGKAA